MQASLLAPALHGGRMTAATHGAPGSFCGGSCTEEVEMLLGATIRLTMCGLLTSYLGHSLDERQIYVSPFQTPFCVKLQF